jgi:predicted acyl esterase
MQLAVFDTYVTTVDGLKMHFDVYVPTEIKLPTVLTYAQDYLKSRSITATSLNSENCAFCHIEKAELSVETIVLEKGYYIFEMEGCS